MKGEDILIGLAIAAALYYAYTQYQNSQSENTTGAVDTVLNAIPGAQPLEGLYDWL